MDIDLFSGKRRRGTLSRQHPPSTLTTRPSLRKHSSQSVLQRAPSDPVYTRSTTALQSTRDYHQRSQSNALASSTSSLSQTSSRPSPTIHSTDFFSPTSNAYQSQTPFPPAPYTLDDKIGALTMQESANTFNRPSLPPHTHTSPDLRFHQLRQSQGYTHGIVGVMETTPPRSENGTMSPKRISTGDSQMIRPIRAQRKKSGFSSFMNNMLGSPRGIRISAPENPTHITHVCFDNKTGQFKVSSDHKSPLTTPSRTE